MHMEPFVPNLRPRGVRPRVAAGIALAIEPMVSPGDRPAPRALDDSWTVVTNDGARSAHWEHTVALTDSGPVVLTALDGGVTRLADVGITVGDLG